MFHSLFYRQQNCMKPHFPSDKSSSAIANSAAIDGGGVVESAYAESRDIFGTMRPNMKGHFDGVKFCSAEDIARRKENEENGLSVFAIDTLILRFRGLV